MSKSPGVDPIFSFEVFPPAQPQSYLRFRRALKALDAAGPDFISVTYGAAGGGQARSLSTVGDLVGACRTPIVAHLTCVGASRDQVDAVAGHFRSVGVRAVVALGGDPPENSEEGDHPDRYPYACDLVAALNRKFDFEINVAAFPEGRPPNETPADDIEILKKKADAGADRAITQYFFDNEAFFRYRDAAAAAGIGIDVVPGLMPVANLQRLKAFSDKCGAIMPDWLFEAFEGTDGDAEAHRRVALDVLVDQVETLRDGGVGRFHLYTLNQTALPLGLFEALGVGNRQSAAA